MNEYSEGDLVGVVWLSSGDFIEVRENFVITKWNSSYVQQWKRTVVVGGGLITGSHPVDNNNIKIITYEKIYNFNLNSFAETNQGDMISANKWARIDRYILHSKNGFINFPGIFKNLKKIVS